MTNKERKSQTYVDLRIAKAKAEDAVCNRKNSERALRFAKEMEAEAIAALEAAQLAFNEAEELDK